MLIFLSIVETFNSLQEIMQYLLNNSTSNKDYDKSHQHPSYQPYPRYLNQFYHSRKYVQIPLQYKCKIKNKPEPLNM